MNAIKKFFPLAVLLVLATGASAQFGRRGGGQTNYPADLLRRNEVKDELKLSTDQRGKVSDAIEASGTRMREAFQNSGIQFGPDMTDEDRAKLQKLGAEQASQTDKDLEAILTPDQQKRLRELFVQRVGAMAAANPNIAKDLGVSQDQSDKIHDLMTKMMQANMKLFQAARENGGDFSGVQADVQKNQKILSDTVAGLLSADQKAKLDAWKGAPFTFAPDTPGGR